MRYRDVTFIGDLICYHNMGKSSCTAPFRLLTAHEAKGRQHGFVKRTFKELGKEGKNWAEIRGKGKVIYLCTDVPFAAED